jgi:hypothetical protein
MAETDRFQFSQVFSVLVKPRGQTYSMSKRQAKQADGGIGGTKK